MNSQLPRIAIPEPTSKDEAYNQRSMPQYIRAIEAAGGMPVPISLQWPIAEQAGLLADCAAILLPGSPADIDPARYGEKPVSETAAKDEAREAADDFLLHDAFERGKPILGICYGLQSLNVWRHGSLIQDLPQASSSSQESMAVVNHEPGREVQEAHPVLVAAGSRLLQAVAAMAEDSGPVQTFVNSSHHQAVSRPGDGLKVVATSPADGVIEALEDVNPAQFVVAVQWHPERTYQSSQGSRELFRMFLEAARSWKPKS